MKFFIEIEGEVFSVSVYDSMEEFLSGGIQGKDFIAMEQREDFSLSDISQDTWKEQCEQYGSAGCINDKTDIHLYLNPEKMDTENWMNVIGHELGHALRPYHRDRKKEEQKAFDRALLVEASFVILMKILDERGYEIKEKTHG